MEKTDFSRFSKITFSLVLGMSLVACTSGIHHGPPKEEAETIDYNYAVKCNDFNGKENLFLGFEVDTRLSKSDLGAKLEEFEFSREDNLPRLVKVRINDPSSESHTASLKSVVNAENMNPSYEPHFFPSEQQRSSHDFGELSSDRLVSATNGLEDSSFEEESEESGESTENDSEMAQSPTDSSLACENHEPFAYSLLMKFGDVKSTGKEVYVTLRKFIQKRFHVSEQTGQAIKATHVHTPREGHFFATVVEIQDGDPSDAKIDKTTTKSLLCVANPNVVQPKPLKD